MQQPLLSFWNPSIFQHLYINNAGKPGKKRKGTIKVTVTVSPTLRSTRYTVYTHCTMLSRYPDALRDVRYIGGSIALPDIPKCTRLSYEDIPVIILRASTSVGLQTHQ